MSDQKVENITVSVRIRPLNERELSSGDTCAWQTENNNSIKEISGTRNFLYDKVYNKDVDTREIFYCQGIEVIEKAISGYNGCIFCYGQTGSGKTYTMHGCKKTNPGIVPLSIDHIFLIIEKSPNKEFLIRCSYIEIYNESVNDLLNPSSLNLQLAEDKKVNFIIEWYKNNWSNRKSMHFSSSGVFFASFGREAQEHCKHELQPKVF
jgi:centromeric protein E